MFEVCAEIPEVLWGKREASEDAQFYQHYLLTFRYDSIMN